MTRSVNLDRYPDADYTPNDMGPPERSNPVEMWDDFEDNEVNNALMAEKTGAPF